MAHFTQKITTSGGAYRSQVWWSKQGDAAKIGLKFFFLEFTVHFLLSVDQ